jgi:ketosteroid isomerase-like protein
MPIETDKVAILKLLDDVRRAHQDKDAAKIVSNYDKDAVIFDLSPPLLSPTGTDANAVQGSSTPGRGRSTRPRAASRSR